MRRKPMNVLWYKNCLISYEEQNPGYIYRGLNSLHLERKRLSYSAVTGYNVHASRDFSRWVRGNNYFTADLDDAHDKMGLQGNVWIPKKGSGNINQKRKQVFAIVTCQTHT